MDLGFGSQFCKLLAGAEFESPPKLTCKFLIVSVKPTFEL